MALAISLFAATTVPAQTCEFVQECGDVDDSGSVSVSDALKVLRLSVGVQQSLVCECSEGAGTCETDLATCTGDLGTCSGDLGSCNSGLSTCNGNLSTCNGDLSSCSNDLSSCNGNLSSCDSDLSGCESDLGVCDGDLATCSSDLSSTNADLAECLASPECGNGVLEEGEECEFNTVDLRGCTLFDQFKGGRLRCGTGCQWDTSDCYESRFVAASGTILDFETKLQWEDKDSSDATPNLSNPHDVDNLYKWSLTGTPADGAAFIDFLSRLNGANDGAGYAGHTDWRLPTLQELQTIAVLSPNCTVPPCVANKNFLPSRSAVYWTSNTDSGTPTNARGLNFDNGGSTTSVKTALTFVRAVRTGLPPLD